MCVKWWFQKFNFKILENVTCLVFSTLENFIKVATLAASGEIFKFFPHKCCIYQNLCMSFMYIFGFLLIFYNIMKNLCKQANTQEITLSKFGLTVMISDRVKYI